MDSIVVKGGNAAPKPLPQRKKVVRKVIKREAKREAKKEAKVEAKKEVQKLVRRIPRQIPSAYHRARNGTDNGLNAAKAGLILPPGANKSVLAVFNTVTMPGTGKMIRIGEEFGSRPTGVASLFTRDDTSFSNIEGKTTQKFLFRSALRFSLTQMSGVDYAAAHGTYYVDCVPQVSQSGAESHLSGSMYTDAGATGPHGTVLYPGRLGPSDPFYGYLGNKGDLFTVAVLDAGVTDAYRVTMYKFGIREWLPQQTLGTLGPAPVVFTTPGGTGYYAFTIRVPITGTGNAFNPRVQLTLATSAIVPDVIPWAQGSLPGLEENIDTIQNIKFHGLSLMWTNTSNMLARSGQIAMMQVPALSWWGNYTGYQNVAQRNVKVEANLEASEGAYLFLKPSGIEDFEYVNEIIPIPSHETAIASPAIAAEQQSTYDAWFAILPRSDYITIACDIPAPAGVDSRTGYWTARTDIEYASVDQWRSLQLPDIRKGELETALVLIAAAPQFHTNDFHLSDLWDWIKGAAKSVADTIVEYGPTVLKVAGAVAPLLL